MKKRVSQFYDLPIGYKLHLVVLLIASLVLLANFVVTTSFTSKHYKQALQDDLKSLAELMADSTQPALLFGDNVTAGRILSAIRAKENIRLAVLYNDNGSVLTSYTKKNSSAKAPIYASLAKGLHCTPLKCSSLEIVEHEGEQVGALYLESELSALRKQQGEVAKAVAIVLIFCFGFSLCFVYVSSAYYC